MKFCIHCGKEFEGNGDLCEQCQSNTEKANQANSSAKSLYYIIFAFALFCIFFNFNPFSKKIKDLTDHPYVLSGFSLKKYHADSSQIKGTVTVQSSADTKLGIEIVFYDKNKSIIENRYDYSPPLNTGDSWAFNVYIPQDSAYYQITRVTFVRN